MATIPALYDYEVTPDQILLTWVADYKSTNIKYNLYGSSTFDGTYTAIAGYQNMPNREDFRTPGSNLAIINRSTLGIGPKDPYFFKITAIDPSGVESFVVDSEFLAVDALDDFYRNRRSDDRNPVYKNIVVGVGGGDVDKEIPVAQILGREANYIKLTSTADCYVAFNDARNDKLLLKANVVYELWKDAIVVTSAYFTFITSTASVEVFVSGN